MLLHFFLLVRVWLCNCVVGSFGLQVERDVISVLLAVVCVVSVACV